MKPSLKADRLDTKLTDMQIKKIWIYATDMQIKKFIIHMIKSYEFSSYLIHGPKIHLSEDSSQEWQRPWSWGEIWGIPIFDNISKEQKYKK